MGELEIKMWPGFCSSFMYIYIHIYTYIQYIYIIIYIYYEKNEPSIDDLPCNGHFPIHFPVRYVHLLESKMNMKNIEQPADHGQLAGA